MRYYDAAQLLPSWCLLSYRKNRRVKCDEGKPDCIRCIKAKRTCGGYIHLEGRSRQDNRDALYRQALIKPKALLLLQDTASSLTLVAPSSIFLGESEIENRYFRYFRQTAVTGLDGAWGWSLWNWLMLQTSHQEPFVRHSIIALGALLKSHETAHLAGVRPRSVIMPYIAKLHRNFAIVKYDRAVKLMQKAICVGTSNPRQALLGCILVVCFEMLIGNSYLAIKHAHSGTLILQQWRTQTLAHKEEQSPLLSPAPLIIEDEIIEAFRSLSIQIITLWDDRSAICDKKIMNYHCVTITAPLTCFDLREAQVYLNLVVCRIYHFIATIQIPSESILLAKKSDGETLMEEVSVITSMAIYSTAFKITETIRAQQVQFAIEIANWMRLFEPFFESLCTKREDNQAGFNCASNVAAMMRMQAIATSILTAGVLIKDEMDYDKFNSRFQELVDLASVIVKQRQQQNKSNSWAGGPWIDIGLTPQLFVVVTRCRDPIIRRTAIKLLEGWYIEGIWDPALIVQIGLFIMEVEEEGLEDVDFGGGKKFIIPERARAVISRISEDSQKRRALIQCVLKSGGVDGGPVWREKYVEW
ncbi:hypothetical protein OIDMADRAFT_60334 [Oidiodendron maius Zn]|uniref:Zn(2)-C6 fungal-type domain-containing protein n=1 Tax=Oidiodendron maius (strain Zn) TaxID=913774 RepID=A0A0C3C6P1_OIDMZ|nr:hypothetical protein OIDMADRAFT_60334 [Oidiodendron maius Zn]